MNLFEQATKHLSSLGDLSVRYSTYTRQWFATVDRLEIGDGNFLTSPTEHRETPQGAVEAYFQRLLQEVGERELPFVFNGEQRIVTSPPGGERRAYLWNGVCFYVVTEDNS